jgi:hypothetical protein
MLMIWYYQCPYCREWQNVDWEKHGQTVKCGKCATRHDVPGPAKQPDAFVDTHDWPAEMEDAVRQQKGKKCTVDGCDKVADTLDHRTPFSKGGRTSAKNLWPMCDDHNKEKGDLSYETFLFKLRIFS